MASGKFIIGITQQTHRGGDLLDDWACSVVLVSRVPTVAATARFTRIGGGRVVPAADKGSTSHGFSRISVYSSTVGDSACGCGKAVRCEGGYAGT